MAKSMALRKGEMIARGTAKASFKVIETKGMARAASPYTPSSLVFRPYAVKKGKIVMLKDTYIQKRGMRISSAGEVSEISRLGAKASAKARAERKSAGIKVKYTKTKGRKLW